MQASATTIVVTVAILAAGDGLASNAIDGYGAGLGLLFPFVDVVRLDLAFGEPRSGARLSIGINLKADKQRDRVR